MSTLRGSLGFKGERGYSAYEVAKQNGFIGTEQDWLATLGTSSNFDRESYIYYSDTVGQTEFELTGVSMANAVVDVYIESQRLDSDEYELVLGNTPKIVLTIPLDVVGTKVEAVVLRMKTNSLPIVETISADSTNETVPGTKAVYELANTLTTEINTKLNSANIKVVTGSTEGISAGGTTIVDVAYPNGFNGSNTVIIGKMVSSNNNYYDTSDMTDTDSGFPIIKQIALIDSGIRIWMKNNSTSASRIGHFKITLLKV